MVEWCSLNSAWCCGGGGGGGEGRIEEGEDRKGNKKRKMEEGAAGRGVRVGRCRRNGVQRIGIGFG